MGWMSAGVAGRPNPNGGAGAGWTAWAAASAGTNTTEPRSRDARPARRSGVCLRVDIGYLPIGRDLPALDAVVVVDRVLAARVDQLRARRLHIARLVVRPALQDRFAASPGPWEPEARMRD